MVVSKIRVAHIITSLETGGAEVMLANLLSCMDRAAFEAEVISLTDKGPVGMRIEALGIPVRALNMQRGKVSPSGLFRLARWLRESRPDLIQTWMYHANLAGGLAAKLAGRVPVVWGIHASRLDPATTRTQTMWTVRLSAWLSSWLPARIVCVSEASRRLHESLGYARGRMLVIPNGFDVDTFVPDAEARASVPRELGLAPGTPLIGMAARFDPQKDHENFVKAAALLHVRMPDVHFLLCGAGATPDNKTLVDWIRAAGLESHCHLLGKRDDMPRLIAGLDLTTTSSSYGEAFPMVIGEAMACAVPVVATDIGDSAHIVGDTGLTVPPRDPQALAGAWADILARGADERRRMGEAARARIQREFTLESVTARYQGLYREVSEK